MKLKVLKESLENNYGWKNLDDDNYEWLVDNLLEDAILAIKDYNLSKTPSTLVMEYISQYSTEEEKEYLKLLKKQRKNKLGSSKYIATGIELAIQKRKVAEVNRALNNLNKLNKESNEK